VYLFQYHNRLYTLDTQIEHADEASMVRLAEWIRRRHLHSVNKRTEARQMLADSGRPLTLLRAQWALQVAAQTKPLPRKSMSAAHGAMYLCSFNCRSFKEPRRTGCQLRATTA
jgi:hypothetical protein